MEDAQSADDLADVAEGPLHTRAPIKSVVTDFSATRDLMSLFTPSSSSGPSRSSNDSHRGPASPKSVSVRGSPSKMADLQVQAMDLSRQSFLRSSSDVTLAPWLQGGHMPPQLQRSSTTGNLSAPGELGYNPPTKLIAASPTDLSREESWVSKDSHPCETLQVPSALLQVLDERLEAFGKRLMNDVEERLSAWEASTRKQLTEAGDFASTMSEQLSAMGGQLVAMSQRISKISNRPSAQLVALEERVISLDRSLSELRCEYLEGCLRSHQMEELLIALHSNIRDLRGTTQVEPKQQMSLPGTQGLGSNRQIVQANAPTPSGHDRAGLSAAVKMKMSGKVGSSTHGSIRGATPPRLETISEVQGDANTVDQNLDSSTANQGVSNDVKYQQGLVSNSQKVEGQRVDTDKTTAPVTSEPEAKLGAEMVVETKGSEIVVETKDVAPRAVAETSTDGAELPKHADASEGE